MFAENVAHNLCCQIRADDNSSTCTFTTEKSVTFTGACANEIIPSIDRSFVHKAKEWRHVRIEWNMTIPYRFTFMDTVVYLCKCLLHLSISLRIKFPQQRIYTTVIQGKTHDSVLSIRYSFSKTRRFNWKPIPDKLC